MMAAFGIHRVVGEVEEDDEDGVPRTVNTGLSLGG